ncbi:DcaP family trimeric outer membrane transporter [Lysobacter korlensis]|uniref:DcaP family trimeric outer membrane transporter n=1 Tax=Lysobacter korlensis TaxID=553636 RepID=A0ABV6RH20_9GAMM
MASRPPRRGVSARVARRPLAAALLVALALPGAAFAQTAKERELEARVAELERMVQQLVAERSAPAVPVAGPAPPAAPNATATAATPPTPVIQTAPITPAANPNTTFTYGGFIKLDAMVTDTTGGEIPDGSAGRLFYLPGTIPVGAPAEARADTDVHAQFSRFWFSADTTLPSGDKLKGYIELDLFGGGSNALLGNEVATNTHGVAVRHAYVVWNRWLAGQAWSNFQDPVALPDAVDFVGPTEGTVFVRQAQLRYTNGPWSFSVENPETTVTPLLGIGPRISSDDNLMPDLTARWLTKGDWGHFTVAALLRELRYDNPATGIDDTARGGGLSVSGRYNIGANDDVRFMATGGRGIGRYLALGGLASDTVLAADGSLEAIDGYGGFVAWRHAFSPKLRGNLFYSMAHFDNDVALTGFGVTERAQSWHANLIYSPLPKLDIGAELIWGQRSLEGEADGDLRRLHTHVKYTF